jgi:hypothetical protein
MRAKCRPRQVCIPAAKEICGWPDSDQFDIFRPAHPQRQDTHGKALHTIDIHLTETIDQARPLPKTA